MGSWQKHRWWGHVWLPSPSCFHLAPALASQLHLRRSSSTSLRSAPARPLSQPQLTSCISPSRWSRLVSPSQSPSSRGLLSLSPSHGHLSRPAPWRGVPFPVWLFTRSSLPSQLSSVRSSPSQSPAGLRLLPSLFKLYF